MLSLLYKRAEALNRRSPEIEYVGEKFFLVPEVYRPLNGEESVVEHLRPQDRVLDLGCGSGIMTVLMARAAGSVVATDLSPAAVECTKRNLAAKGLDSVKVVQGDMFSAVEGKFDKIIANPPWLFFFAHAKAERAWGTSRTYLPTLFREGGKYLTDGPDSRIFAFFPTQFASFLKKEATAGGFTVAGVHLHGPRAPASTRLAYFQLGFNPRWYEFKRA